MKELYRVVATVSVLVAGGGMVAGCVGGPTYGTDKTAGAQLLTDLGDAIAIVPDKKTEKVVYEPRPKLVKPADPRKLEEPQKSLASKDNPAWVESPEDMRARLRGEADDNSDNGTYRSPLMVSVTEGKVKSPEQQAKEFKEARRIQQGAYSDQRRFLSDPPLAYRKVEDPSVLSNLGESEAAKEKRRQKEAVIAGSGRKWWQLF